MSVTLTAKLRWFDRGAAAFEGTFPGLIAARLGADVGPVYVCPICDRPFTREAVEAGTLTAEHVPPESFGGRPLLLTCKACNNEAGFKLDADARKKENIGDAIRGGIEKRLKVRVAHQGRTVNAELQVSESGWKLEVLKKVNDPAVVEEFQSAGPPTRGSDLHVEFVGDRFAELGARLSWFRSGFLAMFAAFGYQFSFDPALGIVKRQLRSPNERLIYSFTIDVPQRFSWGDWRIVEIPEPKCTGVLFGAYVVLFPHRGDLTFYDRLEAHIRSSPSSRATTTAQTFELVGKDPTFGYDLAV